jgi:hypothetical protein
MARDLQAWQEDSLASLQYSIVMARDLQAWQEDSLASLQYSVVVSLVQQL